MNESVRMGESSKLAIPTLLNSDCPYCIENLNIPVTTRVLGRPVPKTIGDVAASGFVLFTCGHAYHMICFMDGLDYACEHGKVYNCPLCRDEVDLAHIVHVPCPGATPESIAVVIEDEVVNQAAPLVAPPGQPPPTTRRRKCSIKTITMVIFVVILATFILLLTTI